MYLRLIQKNVLAIAVSGDELRHHRRLLLSFELVEGKDFLRARMKNGDDAMRG